MAGNTRISKLLIMLFLFLILNLATLVQAQGVNTQDCKTTAKKLMVVDKKVHKIHVQIIHSIGGSKSKIPHPTVDKYNRHVNILIHNLENSVKRMRGLLEDAKQEGNSCQQMASKVSGVLDDMYDIFLQMGKSLDNPKTAEKKLFDLAKNLEQKANKANSEIQSVIQ